jgi:xanthine/uracil permease
MKTKLTGGILSFVGFVLSPISWWNDLVINFPLSYLMALPFGLLNEKLFLPSLVIAYWITNIIGILLMHIGVKKIASKQKKNEKKKELVTTLIFGMFYTAMIIALVLTGVLKIPESMLNRFG